MLSLPGDTDTRAPRMIDALTGKGGAADVVLAIAAAMPALAMRLAAGHLPGNPAAIVGTNDSGDQQKALDVGSHDHVVDALRGHGVRHVLSEEAEEIETIDPDGLFDIAMDPIDGSGSIGLGLPLGTLFAIYPVEDGKPFPRVGTDVIAAGYCSFGHSLDFAWSLGDGVHMATMDPRDGEFRMSHQDVMLPEKVKIAAYNASNDRHWPQGLQDYVADLHAGKDGPRGQNFNMRWLGAAVGDLHRVMLQGGVFLYPADARPGYENGRLRLCYEAIPMAFMVEQAGGHATDGITRILDLVPTDGHQHSPLVFGAAAEVDLIRDYMTSDRAKG